MDNSPLAPRAARTFSSFPRRLDIRSLAKVCGPLAALAAGAYLALCAGPPAIAQEYAFFFDPAYVDTTREAAYLRDSMTGLGLTVNTFTGTSESDFSTALAGAVGLVIPEQERGALYPALDESTKTLLTNFVNDGGLLLISDSAANSAQLINGLFGTSIANGSGWASTLDPTEAAGTVFAGGPATLSGANAVDGFITTSLSAEALAIYQNATGGTTVMLLPEDAGNVVFLGFDWFQFPTPSDWVTVLGESATLYGNVWDGSTDDLWSTASNWSLDVAPGAGDRAYFSGDVHTAVNHDQTAGTVYAGILFCSGADSFTISGNSLGIDDGGSVTNNSPNTQTIAVALATNGNITFDAASGDLVFTQTITIAPSNTLTVTGPSDTLISGAMEGEGALVKSGTGTLTLSGTNSYAGGTTVSAGTLQGTTSSLQGSITNNATVVFDQATNGTYSGNMTGTGALTKSGIGTVTLSGTNSYSGGTTVSAGSLQGNTSSLQGNITNNAAVVFDQATNGTYSGNMTGTGTLTKSGIGILTLSGTDSYSGGTTVSAGALQGTTSSLQGGITNNALVIFNQATSGTYSGDMIGTGSLTKSGTGTVTLSGTNTYSGTTTVSAGRLNVNGSITSDTTIGANGTLGGAGVVSAMVVNNGTVAPGNSIGTLTVENNYTHGTDAELEIEINDGGTTPGTNVDLLLVDGATATILGGSVNVIADPGTYTRGSQYVFLQADSVVGTFDSITDDLEHYYFQLGYTTTSVYMTMLHDPTDYASWGCTSNTVATGAYLDSMSQTATGELVDLLDALDVVAEGDRCRALAQLDGAIYASLAQLGLQNSTLYLQSLARRLRTGLTDGDGLMAGGPASNTPVVVVTADLDQPLIVRGQDCCCGPQWATWFTGFGLGGSASSDGNAPGLDYSLGGALFGAENMVGDHLLGFYGGYLGNYVGTDVAESAKINGAAFGTYLVRHDGCNYYIVIGGLEFDDYESTRNVQFDGLTATGDFDGWKGMAYVERGLTYGGPCLRLQPLAALQYIYLRENRFSEHGAGAADLDVAGIDANSLRSALGARAHGRGWSRHGRCISPEMRAMWIHEFLETDTALNARFNPVGGAMFAVDGLDLGRDWVLAGGGLNWQLGGGWEAYADYDAFVNGHQTMHVGSSGISHVW
jgi:fibronectin-binding autotransporter adhesin